MSDPVSGNPRHVRTVIREGVAHVILSRPDKLNPLGTGPGSSREQILDCLTLADSDDDVNCILISAEGGTFSSGGNLENKQLSAPTPYDEWQFISEIDEFNSGVRSISKPVIAAVQGQCLGAATGFIAQCDFVLASDDAQFGLPEGRFGHPGGSELSLLIGAPWAKFLIFSGEKIDAETARAIGLVLVVLPREKLLSAATLLAERIARMPANVVRLNKASIDRARESSGAAAGRLSGRSVDAVTKAMSSLARAPDGRTFGAILAEEGVKGLRQAQSHQFTGSWLKIIRDENEGR